MKLNARCDVTTTAMRIARRGVLVLALLLLVSTVAAASAELTGKVVGVADGDTLTVLTDDQQRHTIRLNGIDAPEAGQDFGQVSKRHLSELVSGKTVVVHWTKRDRYGRTVGTVMLDAVNVNLEQVTAGLAWYFRQYAGDVPVAMRPVYEQAETTARSEKRGLWVLANPTPPWEYRHPDPSTIAASGPIIGNRSSKIYHLPNCPDYLKVAERNRVPFASVEEAEQAGFRKARNCG